MVALSQRCSLGVLVLPKQTCMVKVQKHWNPDHEREKTGEGSISQSGLDSAPGSPVGQQMEGRGAAVRTGSGLRALLQAGRHRQKGDLGNHQLPLRPRR